MPLHNVMVSETTSFEISGFGEYSVPHGTKAAVLLKQLRSHLRLSQQLTTHLYADGLSVDGRATAGVWPLTAGARLSFEEDPQSCDPLQILESLHFGTSTTPRGEALTSLARFGIMMNAGKTHLRAPITAIARGSVRPILNAVAPNEPPANIPELRELAQSAHSDTPRRAWFPLPRLILRTFRLACGRLPATDGVVLRVKDSLEEKAREIEIRGPLPVAAFERYCAEAAEESREFDPESQQSELPAGQTHSQVVGAAPNARGRSVKVRQAANTDAARGALVPVLSAVIPLVLSAGLAFFLKQPMFLLFALTGPLLAFVQFAARKRPLPQDLNYHQFPQWLRRGLHGQTLNDILAVKLIASRLGTHSPSAPLPSKDVRALQRIVPSTQAQQLAVLALAHGVARQGFIQVIAPRAQAKQWMWLRWLFPLVTLYDSPDGLLPALRSQGAATGTSPDALTVVVGWNGTAAIFAPGSVWNPRALDAAMRSAKVRGDLGNAVKEYSTLSHAAADSEQIARICAAASLRQVVSQDLPNSANMPMSTLVNYVPAPWDRNSWDSFVITFGVDAQGTHNIDVTQQGPHMLVAGTTGSGKSEFLISFILSAAQQYSPRELNIVLVDYKGGAGLGRAAALPHCVGMVTDLDSTEASRALHGIRLELTRREHVLADSGTSHFAQHNAHCAEQDILPRLLIVVDEFRALSDELPDFLPRLVRLAAQGRSLGMHLVLATQRPAGAVSPEMRANISLRVCLRVSDEQDSLDVVGVTDGAHISPARPGRLLVSSGNAAANTLQSLYCAEGSSQLHDLSRLNSWHEPLTLHTAMYASEEGNHFTELSSAFVYNRYGLARRLWAPALPQAFAHVDCEPQYRAEAYAPSSAREHSCVPSALVAPTDSVEVYRRNWLSPCPAGSLVPNGCIVGVTSTGNAAKNQPDARPQSDPDAVGATCMLVVAPSQRGKTTALAALGLDCSSFIPATDAVAGGTGGSCEHPGRSVTSGSRTIHWIGAPQDFAGVVAAFSSAQHAHLANVIDQADAFLIHALLSRMLQSSDPSSPHTTQFGPASVELRSHDSAPTIPMAHTQILLIDNLEVVRTTLESFDRGSGVGLLDQVLRAGQTGEIKVAAACTRLPPTQLLSLFPQRLLLSSGSKETDGLNGVPRELLPLPSIVGRGVWVTAQSTDSCQIRDSLNATNARDTDLLVKPISDVSPEPGISAGTKAKTDTSTGFGTSTSFGSTFNGNTAAHPERIWSLGELPDLPVSGITVGYTPAVLAIQQFEALIVTGARRSGRTQTLKALGRHLKSHGYTVVRIYGRDPNCDVLAKAALDQINGNCSAQFAVQIDDLDVFESRNSTLAVELLTTAQQASAIVQATCTSSALTSAFRGALSELREHECVLLLDPRSHRDREVCTVSIARAIDSAPFTGKAVFVHSGQALPARVNVESEGTP